MSEYYIKEQYDEVNVGGVYWTLHNGDGKEVGLCLFLEESMAIEIRDTLNHELLTLREQLAEAKGAIEVYENPNKFDWDSVPIQAFPMVKLALAKKQLEISGNELEIQGLKNRLRDAEERVAELEAENALQASMIKYFPTVIKELGLHQALDEVVSGDDPAPELD